MKTPQQLEREIDALRMQIAILEDQLRTPYRGHARYFPYFPGWEQYFPPSKFNPTYPKSSKEIHS